jgi:hypothetical protein
MLSGVEAVQETHTSPPSFIKTYLVITYTQLAVNVEMGSDTKIEHDIPKGLCVELV